jgi:hypothetical protein
MNLIMLQKKQTHKKHDYNIPNFSKIIIYRHGRTKWVRWSYDIGPQDKFSKNLFIKIK